MSTSSVFDDLLKQAPKGQTPQAQDPFQDILAQAPATKDPTPQLPKGLNAPPSWKPGDELVEDAEDDYKARSNFWPTRSQNQLASQYNQQLDAWKKRNGQSVEEDGQPTIPGMEKLGALPGAPRPPLPADLQSAQQQAAQRPVSVSARTGQRYQEPAPGQSIFDTGPVSGARRVVSGAEALADSPNTITAEDVLRAAVPVPDPTGHLGPLALLKKVTPQQAKAANDMIGGAMEIASPLLIAGGFAAPAEMAASFALGAGGQKATEAILEKAGVDPAYRDLGSTLAGLFIGYGAAHIRLDPDQVTLMEALRGKDPGGPEAVNHTIESIKARAERGSTYGERLAAQTILERRYGIKVDIAPAAPDDPIHGTANAAPQPPTPSPTANSPETAASANSPETAAPETTSGPVPSAGSPTAPPQAVQPEVSPGDLVPVRKGAVYQTPEGTITVAKISGSQVLYTRTDADGNRTVHFDPIDKFSAMVKAPLETERPPEAGFSPMTASPAQGNPQPQGNLQPIAATSTPSQFDQLLQQAPPAPERAGSVDLSPEPAGALSPSPSGRNPQPVQFPGRQPNFLPSLDTFAPRAPAGWESVEPSAFERHPSVDQTDDQLRAAAVRDPLPLPKGTPKSMGDAWDTVSRIVPELASKVTEVGELPKDSPENAAVNVQTGVLRVNPDRPLSPESLWHELIHLDQPEAQQGRNALEPDKFNALEIQARAGISDALERFKGLQPQTHDFSSTQANMPAPIADAVRAFGKTIPDKHLNQEKGGGYGGPSADDGRESEPHVTVKYGLHGEDPAAVRKAIENEPPIQATLGRTSVFHTPDADVLKLDVESPDLHRLNAAVAKLPNTDTYPEYIPHVTIAYLKKGQGDQYAGMEVPGVTGQQVSLPSITFSSKNGERTDISLTGKSLGVEQPGDHASVLTGTSEVPQQGAGSRLADHVYQLLRSGQPLGNQPDFYKTAEQFFGSPRTSGHWDVKDAMDAMEAGVNKWLVENGAALMKGDPIQSIAQLRQLQSLLPTQGTRTDEQLKAQQFSTPPAESFVAAKAAGINPNDVVLEPSAGNGGLAAWPKAIGAQVHVNEISDRRAQMLEAAGFGKPTAHDGELINALLDPAVKPTVVLMNPPFSSGALKSHAAKNRNQYGFNHVDQALQRLQAGGRLVAILGGGRADDLNGGASFTGGSTGKWFDRVRKLYNVRANVRIDGKEYQKYGTNFATRILVIDKTGPTDPSHWMQALTGKGPIVQGNADTLEQAYNLLRNVAADRQIPSRTGVTNTPGQGERPVSVGTGSQPDSLGGGQVRAGGDGSPESGQPADRPSEPARGPGIVQPHPGNQPAGLQQPGPGSPQPDGVPGAAHPEGGPQSDELRPVSGDGQPGLELSGQPGAELTGDENTPGALRIEREDAPVSEKHDTEAYVVYRPAVKGGKHPGDIVETTTMATVPSPKLTAKINLPANVGISSVQLEGVGIGVQQNEIVLPGGARAAALIGDGTGVGKGREAAAYLWHHWREGRKRLVWVSEKWDLMQDAMRDLTGIGASDMLGGVDRQPSGKFVVTPKSSVQPLNRWNYGAKISHQGLIFSTYGTVRAKDKKGNRRAAQLEEYLRGDDDGEGAVIVFDEAHNLKNAVPARGTPASQIGKAVKDLLEKIPKLRTLSLSATAATDVVNLGYLDRLGLWGPGTPFPNGFSQFQNEIARGGLSAMEMIARELKAQGKYLSRTLSFHGVQYDTEEHKLSDDQKELYRTAAKAWGVVLDNAVTTIENVTNGGGEARGNFLSQFYGAQQRFFNVLITTLKVPTAIELANKALADKKAVVITLVNTNEAAQNREKNRALDEGDEDEVPDYDFGPKEMLVDLVKNHFPTQQWADDVNDNGDPIKVPVYTTDASGREIPVQNPAAIEARDALVEQINKDLHMPDNPLDILIQGLGGEKKVAELTGRKERYDRNAGKFISRGDPGVPQKDTNLVEMQKFQGGKKDIAILSGAAGTGISLHAGNDVANQKQRYHITLQVGWSADKAMQMFGRTHRTNQKQPPQYVMLVSDLGGEKRFVSTISRRLGSLGALTKGQKNATGGNDLMDKVNFETDQGRQATNTFYERMLRNQSVPGTDLTGMQVLHDLHVLKPQGNQGVTVPPAERTNVTRLLNRLLALDPDVQNPVYNYFYDLFQATVQDAIDRGQLDTGVKTLPGDAFHIKEQRVISKDPKTGAETFYYPVDVEMRTHRVSPEDLDKRLAQHAHEHPNFILSAKGELALLIDAPPIVRASGSVEPAYYASTPKNGKWIKIAQSGIPYKSRDLSKHAAEELEKAQYLINDAERRLRFAEQGLAREPGSASYQEVQKSAKAEEANARQALENAQEMAKNPTGWAKSQWAEQYENAATRNVEEHHLIGGAVMRFWNPINDLTGRPNIYTALDSKTGKRIVGVEIPGESIKELLQRITGNASTVNAAQLVADVLRNNLSYTLEGGIQVRPGRVGKDRVIQLIPPNRDVAENLKRLGVLYEKGVQPIYYLPSGEQGPLEKRQSTVAGKILEQYPVQQDSPSVLASRVPARNTGDTGSAQQIPRLPEAPLPSNMESPSPEEIDAHWNGAQIQTEVRDGVPVVWTNNAAFGIISQRIGQFATGDNPDELAGMALNRGQRANLDEEARVSAKHPQEAFDRSLARIGEELRKLPPGPIAVVQTGRAFSDADIQRAVEEELDHVLHEKLPGGVASLPKHLLDTDLGKRSLRGLAILGYKLPNPKSPFYEYDRAIMTSEVGVRLMHPRLYTELLLTRAEAKELATQFVNDLVDRHGDNALKIADRMYDTIKAYEAEIERYQALPERDEASHQEALAGIAGRPNGPPDSPALAYSRRPVEGLKPEEHPALARFADYLRNKFKPEDVAKVNYSGLGSLIRTFLPGRQMAEVEAASRPVFEAAVRAASADAITSTAMLSAMPAIQNTLKGSGYTRDQLLLYYTESRLLGLKDRWQNFAEQARQMTPEQTKLAMSAQPDGTKSPFLALMSSIEGKRGMPNNAGQAAAALAGAGDWDLLREFIALSYEDAAARVASVMSPEDFDEFHEAVKTNPKVKEADRLYGDLLEKPMAQSHAVNEGVFSDALGPAGRYLPLMTPEVETKGGPGRRLPYHKPRNRQNTMATGLAETYAPTPEGLAKRLSLANRANYKAALLQTMKDEGWLVPESDAYKTEEGLAMRGPDDIEYRAVRVETNAMRTLIQGGKVIHLPGRNGVIPDFMHRGLATTLQREPMDPDAVVGAMRWANFLATKGPMELVFHSAGVLGALYANTPFLGGSGLAKALSLPLVKWFALRGKVFSIDPTSPENVKKLQEMANAGALPAKSSKVTYSKEFAEQTGAKRERFSFAPALYGPKGIDARARILMYDIFKAAYPNGTTSDLHHFVNQLANYTPEMQGRIETWLKQVGLGPFATAGMTRIVNSIHTFTGTGPGPGQTAESRLWWWLTASAYIALASWVVAHKLLTGKNPTEDRRAQLFQLPVGGGTGYLDQYRHSWLGNALWGKGPETGYLNFGFFDNPLALRGARAMGLADAFKSHQLGANAGQMGEAAEKGVINAFAHPTLGPATRAIFVGATGEEAYITAFRDRGQVALRLFPAINPKTRPGLNTQAAKAWAAMKQLNSFYTEGAENLGEMTGISAPRPTKGDWWTRTMFNIVTPGFVGPASNVWKSANAIRQEQNAERRF